MKILFIFAMICLLCIPTASAQITDFTVIEPFPETVVAGDTVSATVCFVSDQEPFNLTLTFTSPIPLSADRDELIDIKMEWDVTPNHWCTCAGIMCVCDGNMSGSCMYEYSDYSYIQHCIINNYGGTNELMVGFLLNPAIQPDNYHFTFTVSGYGEEPYEVTTSTKRSKKYSGNYVTQESAPTPVYSWSPYEDLNGNGTIHLGDPENDTDFQNSGGGGWRLPDEEQTEPEDSGIGYFMMFMLLALMLMILIRQAYDYRGSNNENK